MRRNLPCRLFVWAVLLQCLPPLAPADWKQNSMLYQVGLYHHTPVIIFVCDVGVVNRVLPDHFILPARMKTMRKWSMMSPRVNSWHLRKRGGTSLISSGLTVFWESNVDIKYGQLVTLLMFETWQGGVGPVSKSSMVLLCDALDASEEPGSWKEIHIASRPTNWNN